MDDARTRKTLDALADLFLTGTNAATGTTGRPASSTPSNEAQLAQPIRMAPKTQVGTSTHQQPAAPFAGERRRQPEVAGVIGGRREHRQDKTRSAGRPPETSAMRHHVQAVFLGNLPGFGQPWLTQYAHHLAKSRGPVAVLHVDDDYIDLELVATVNHAAVERMENDLAHHDTPQAGELLRRRLEALHQHESAPVKTFLVHIAAINSQSVITLAMGLDRWTLLTGTDEAAVTAAYRLLKRLLVADPNSAKRQVGLMMMGSDQDKARRAAEKIGSTTDSFLDTPVTLVGAQAKMMPVCRRLLGSFANPTALWPGVINFLESPPEPPEAPSPEAAPAAMAGDVEPQPVVSPSQHDDDHIDLHQTLAEMDQRKVAMAAMGMTEPATMVDDPPEPTNVAAKPRQTDPMLAQYVPGSLPMDARCPQQPQVQLALDQQGTVHLLHQHQGGANDAKGLQAVVVDLIEARRWVRSHLPLIKLTQRQCRFEDDAVPVLHLFTDDARLATAMVTRLGSTLQLHLLKRVELGDQAAWYCTPLN